MCEHLKRLFDEHTSTIVCLTCGLVLDEQVPTQSVENAVIQMDPCYDRNLHCHKEFIFDCCDRMHIFQQAAEDAFHLFRQWRRKPNIRKSDLEALCCLCIFHSLKSHDVPRPLKVIANACGVGIKAMWKIEAKINPSHKKNTTEDLLKSSLHKVNLGVKHEDHIIQILSKFKSRHFAPSTLIASILYLYCKKQKMKMTMKMVSQSLQISPMSVYRCVSYLKTENIIAMIDSCT